MLEVMIRDHGTALFQSRIPGVSRQHQTTAADGGALLFSKHPS